MLKNILYKGVNTNVIKFYLMADQKNLEFEYFDMSKNVYSTFSTKSKKPICEITCIDVKENDPDNLIYYCKNGKCKKYHKIFKDDQLKYAIFYMESKKANELFSLMSQNEIENFKMNNCQNLMDYVIYSLGSIGGQREVPTLDNIWNDSFTSPFYKDKEKEKCKKYLELLKVICKYFPHLINEKHFGFLNRARNYETIEILNNYYFENKEDMCYVCFGSYKNELINSICDCKNLKIHVGCLTKIAKHCDKCGVCKKHFNCGIDSRNRIFFPYSNIYWSPLMSNVEIIEDDDVEKSLVFATTYLVIDRVKEILENMSDEKFIEIKNKYKNNKDVYYSPFIHDNLCYLMMTPNPPSNMNSIKYQNEHYEINLLLKNRELKCKHIKT